MTQRGSAAISAMHWRKIFASCNAFGLLHAILRAKARNSDFPRKLFRGTQRCAEIAQLVIDLIGSPDSLSDFFAEQSAITITHSMHKRFHCRLAKPEYSGKCCVRYILPLRSETTAQHIKDPSSAALLTFVAQSP